MQYHYLEGQTPLDEEEKLDLIPSILTREDLDQFEQENIIEARQWAMQKSLIAKHDVFTEKFLCNLHKHMYGYVWKWAGKYRQSNKNIGVEYYLIPIELRKLIDDAHYWLDHQIYDLTELAIIFHHRLVKIHLFPNGNGRHARLCADIIIEQNGADKISWGGSLNLSKPEELRKCYISALRKADYGDYAPLLAFAQS